MHRAHHKGHFEFHACPISHGDIPTQECFDQHPLTFISDTNDWAVRHEEYPERAYLEPDNWQLSYKFQLPDNLTGIWYYFSGITSRRIVARRRDMIRTIFPLILFQAVLVNVERFHLMDVASRSRLVTIICTLGSHEMSCMFTICFSHGKTWITFVNI